MIFYELSRIEKGTSCKFHMLLQIFEGNVSLLLVVCMEKINTDSGKTLRLCSRTRCEILFQNVTGCMSLFFICNLFSCYALMDC